MSREFDGATDRLDWASITTLTGDPVTISAWIYSDGMAGNVDYIFCAHIAGNTGPGLIFFISSTSRIVFTRIATTTLTRGGTAGSSLTAGWHHLLVTHDGTINDYTTIHIYEAGVDRSDNTGAQNGATETAPSGSWSLGGRINDDARNFDGKIAEVGVWDRVLSAGEIAALAAGATPDSYSTNLIFYYSARTDTTTAETGGAAATDDGTAYSSAHPLLDYFMSLAGAITPAGGLINSARKILAGALTWAGDLATQFTGGGGTEYEQAVDGALTPAGALVNSARKILAGVLTPAGEALKRAGKVVAGGITPAGPAAWIKDVYTSPAGAITPSGTVTKRTGKPLAGELTPAGVVATVKAALMSLAGALTPAGAVVLRTGKVLAGAVTPDGALVKAARKVLAGEITPAGVVATIKAALMSLTGALTPAGAVVLRTGKGLAGAITPDGAVVKAVRKVLSGELSSSGILSAIKGGGTVFYQAVAGVLTPAGDLVAEIIRITGGLYAAITAARGRGDSAIRRREEGGKRR